MMKTKMVYQWGGRSHGVDPQVVGETIEKIAGKGGSCSPVELVEVAHDDASPLHSLFTWEDEVAAGHWRVHEARNVINSLTVTIGNGDMQTVAPAFISVGHVKATQGEGVGYRPISVVLGNEYFAQEALDEALLKLESLEKRYASLKELSPVWRALQLVKAA